MALCLSDIFIRTPFPRTPSIADGDGDGRRARKPPHFDAAAADGEAHATRYNSNNGVFDLEVQQLMSVLGKRGAPTHRSGGKANMPESEPKRLRDSNSPHEAIFEGSFPRNDFKQPECFSSLRNAAAESPRSSASPAAASAAALQGRLLRYKAFAQCAPAQSSATSPRDGAGAQATTGSQTTIIGLLQNIKQKKHEAVSSQCVTSSPRDQRVTTSLTQRVTSSPRPQRFETSPTQRATSTRQHDGVRVKTQRQLVSADIEATTYDTLSSALRGVPVVSSRRATTIAHRDFPKGRYARQSILVPDIKLSLPADDCDQEASFLANPNILSESHDELFPGIPELPPATPDAQPPPPKRNIPFSAKISSLPQRDQFSRTQLPPSQVRLDQLPQAPVSHTQTPPTRVSRDEVSAPPGRPFIAPAYGPASAPTCGFAVPPNAANFAPSGGSARNARMGVEESQGNLPSKMPTTLKGKEPSWNNLVSLFDLNDGGMLAGGEGCYNSQIDKVVSAEVITSSCHESSQYLVDTSVEDEDASIEDGLGLAFSNGLLDEMGGCRKETLLTTGMGALGAGVGFGVGIGDSVCGVEATSRRGTDGSNDDTGGRGSYSGSNTDTRTAVHHRGPPSVLPIGGAHRACPTTTDAGVAHGTGGTACVFLPTPLQPTNPTQPAAVVPSHLVLPPPAPGSCHGGRINVYNGGCNGGCVTGCNGDCNGEWNSNHSCVAADASPSPHSSAQSPSLPSTPPGKDIASPILMQAPRRGSGGAGAEESQIGGCLVKALVSCSAAVKEEDWGWEAGGEWEKCGRGEAASTVDAEVLKVGGSAGRSMGVCSRSKEEQGEVSMWRFDRGTPADASQRRIRRRLSNRASAKRIRMRQQELLLKLEAETRELAAVGQSLGAQLVEASRGVERLKEQYEAMREEKGRLLLLLGGRREAT